MPVPTDVSARSFLNVIVPERRRRMVLGTTSTYRSGRSAVGTPHRFTTGEPSIRWWRYAFGYIGRESALCKDRPTSISTPRCSFFGAFSPKRGTRSHEPSGRVSRDELMMDENRRRGSTTLTNVALTVVVVLAGVILFSRFVFGVAVFQCMSEDNHVAQTDCVQHVVVEHLNRGF